APEDGHGLDVERVREQVDRGDRLDAEPPVDEQPGVAGEGGGVATDEDDGGGVAAGDNANADAPEAGPAGVGHDDVGGTRPPPGHVGVDDASVEAGEVGAGVVGRRAPAL